MSAHTFWIAAALLAALTGFAPSASAQVRWDTWWQNHELEFLWGNEPWSVQVERGSSLAGFGGAPISGGPAGLPGSGSTHRDSLDNETTAPVALRRGFAYGRVVPVLLQLLEDSDDPRMRKQAVRSLGRVVEPRFARLISSVLREALSDDSTAVRAEAAFALGLVYDPENGDDLLAIASNTPAGRRLVGGERVPDAVRRGALAGLSAAGDERLIPELISLYEKTSEREISLRRTLVMALGFGSGERAPQIAKWLHAALADVWLDPLVRTQIPTALGHLGQRESIPVLLELLDERTLDSRIQQSCLLGLGDLSSPADLDVITKLLKIAVEEKDPDSRRYALLAAVRVLGRDPDPSQNVASHVLFIRTLRKQLEAPSHRDDGPHHALAAGMYLRPHRAQAPKLHALLLDELDDVKDPARRGAYALAVGLSAVESTGELLHEIFNDNKDQLFRAECALAIGFVGHKPAAQDLIKLFDERGLHPRLIELVGTALMLLGDERAAELILERLLDSGNFEERLGLMDALAHFRGEAVLDRVLDLVLNERLDMITRIGLCAVLGKQASWQPLPLSDLYSVGRNLGPRDHALDGLLGTPLDERGAISPELEEEDDEEAAEEDG